MLDSVWLYCVGVHCISLSCCVCFSQFKNIEKRNKANFVIVSKDRFKVEVDPDPNILKAFSGMPTRHYGNVDKLGLFLCCLWKYWDCC